MIYRLKGNTDVWVDTGKKASSGGDTAEAMNAVFVLFAFMFSGLQQIAENQGVIYEAIIKAGQNVPRR